MAAKPRPNNLLEILSLTQVLETIPSGLFLVDLDQRIVSWNAAAERITGFSAEEVVGQHCSVLKGIECGNGCGLYSPDMPKPIINAACRIITKSGKEITLSKNIDLLWKDGKPVGGIESFNDITQQKQLETQLRQHAEELEAAVAVRTAELEQERTRLSGLLDAMTDFAYIVSPLKRVLFMNRAMIEAIGDQVGKNCHQALFGLDEVCENCPLAEVATGETVREERRNDKTGRTYEVLHTPLMGVDGICNKLAVCRDITERKEIEEALRSTNQELDDFVRSVSHDLRVPLAPIISIAEFLRLEYGETMDAQCLDLLQDIEKQGERMLALLEDLLLLARVGKVPPPSQRIPLQPLVQSVVNTLTSSQSTLQTAVAIEELPDARIPESLLRQIFSNLIGNAMRYAGSSDQPISVGGKRDGRLLSLYVLDHGPGIPQLEREQVFDLFFRGSSGRKHSGTGIGLATVRKITRLYGGKAWIVETPGGGCTFRVELIEPE